MPTAFIGGAQKPNLTVIRNQQQIFEGMLFFLAAVVEALFIRVSWSIYGSFRSVVEKKAVLSDVVAAGGSPTLIAAVRAGSTPCIAKA